MRTLDSDKKNAPVEIYILDTYDRLLEGCKDLETITVSGEWSAKNSSYDEAMFSGCSALKGGNGTEYNANYIGKERAIADLDNDHKGWLSYIML